MPRSIFLSYVYEDKAYAERIHEWCRKGLLGPSYGAIDEGKDVRHLGDAVVANHLRSRIQGAAVVLALIGKDTHNHEWVRKELAIATSLNKQVLLMRIPDTNGSPPADFGHRAHLAFDPTDLRAALAAYW